MHRFILPALLLVLSLGATPSYAQGDWQLLIEFDTIFDKPNLIHSSTSSVYFLETEGPPRIGWAGYYYQQQNAFGQGKLMMTNDGGITWRAIYETGDGMKGYGDLINGITAKDSNHIAFSMEGGITTTTDGGKTWSPIVGVLPDSGLHRFPDVEYIPASDLLVGTCWETSLSVVSTDWGQSWSPLGRVPNLADNGVTFSNELTGLIGNMGSSACRVTTDGGLTWIVKECPNEIWGPHGIRGTTTFYAVEDIGTKVFRTTNAGDTWSEIGEIPFNVSTGTVQGDLCQLYIQGFGIYLSETEGSTWEHLGGPRSSSDTRFYARYNIIYAIDEERARIWRYVLPDPSHFDFTLNEQPCGVAGTSLRFQGIDDCSRSRLLSLSVEDASYEFTNVPDLPHVIKDGDSIVIRAKEISTGPSTVNIRMRIERGFTIVDTMIAVPFGTQPNDKFTISGFGLSLNATAPVTETTVASGETQLVYVRPLATIDAETSLQTVTFTLHYNTDVLTLKELLITTGWKLTDSLSTQTGLQVTLERVGNGSIDASTHLLIGLFRTTVSLNSSSTIELSDLTVNGTTQFQDCFTRILQAQDIATVGITAKCGDSLFRQILRNEPLFSIVSIVPNPQDRDLGTDCSITIRSAIEEVSHCYIYDLNGRRSIEQTIALKQGEHTYQLNTKELPAGVYFVHVRVGNDLRTTKLAIND